jgi:chlorophyllide a reductase subunit X
VHTGPVTKETQIIAIYGKGGIGKSFTLANLSYMMAQQGKKTLLIGCDPKSDTTSLLFGGHSTPTIIETSSKKKAAGEEVAIGDVCFKRDGVYAMELGGPEVGRGCGGRGIIHGFEPLRNSASTTGISTTFCSTSWATWSAAVSACRSPATCARR